MISQTNQHFRSLFILTLVVVASHFWFKTVDWTGHHANIDLARYRSMAAAAPEIRLAGEAPFCYRILPPWLAGVTGKGLDDELWGFRLVSALAVLFASMMLYVYLISKDVRGPTALLMASLAVISQHALGGVVFNPFQTCDALAIGLMLVMLLCIERGWLVGFVVASVVGALTREPCMLMLPVALTYVVWRARREQGVSNLESGDHSIWKHSLVWLLACVPALVVFAFVRHIVHPVNPEWSLGAMLYENSYKLVWTATWVRLIFLAAAPISLIPLYFYRQTRQVVRENVHLVVLLVLVVASSFLGADTERLVAPALVVYYLIAARVLDLRPSATLNAIIVVAALVCSMNPLFSKYTLFTEHGVLGGYAVLVYYLAALTMNLVVLVATALIVKKAFRTTRR